MKHDHNPPCPGPEAHLTKKGAPSCTGHKRTPPERKGEPCENAPMHGQVKCRMHGGSSPQAKKAAAARIEADVAEQWLLENVKDAAPLGSLREVYDELLAVGGMARQWRLIMADRVSQLQSLGYQGTTGEQVRADVVLFERGMDRSMKVTELIARLNLDERREAIAASDGAKVAQVLRSVLDQLHLTPEQQHLVPTVVPAALRLIAGELSS